MIREEHFQRDSMGLCWLATRLLQNKIQIEIHKSNDLINVEQLFMLMELNVEDGLRPSVLAERMVRSKGTISSLIRHAKRNEFVAVSDDPSHKNAKRVFLTVYGKKLHDQLTPIVDEVIAESLQGVSKEHIEAANEVMGGVIKKLSPKWFNDTTQDGDAISSDSEK
ncbi:MarR family winged helix-turn-helix transcriptional regulator [Photobacterium leiognathi]|uniref:MarR family winged helix-turn-helix transcriptional regulator n=1 Tax=Photobacterium leiognathi TaxID=553611 RepID=UPI0006B61624|nr:MarR family transcriptional regulator [Photobacterium leiognathi]KPA54543.1 hypothetical protein VT25_01230 [Photobacterium leiognathi subsp. mandapamensis]